MSPGVKPGRALAGLALAAASAASCGGGEAAEELTVFAAASLRDALLELGETFRARSGARLVLSFGSSGDLARAILAGGGADLFLSADEQEMDRVAGAGLLADDSRRSVLSNQLVVIEPADAGSVPSLFRQPFAPAQLAGEELALLALANPDTVPAGRYAREWLEAQGIWEAVELRVLPLLDVRAALAAVASGAARAGIVYRTDAATTPRVRVVHALLPGEGPRISYSLAVIAGPGAARARELAGFLASREALAVFERFGFVALEQRR